jgi:hypothetical protein
LRRGCAGNVLARVGSGEIKARIHQCGIEILSLLEILDRGVVLAVFEGGDALVKEVAGLEFIAAGHTACENENSCGGGYA